MKPAIITIGDAIEAQDTEALEPTVRCAKAWGYDPAVVIAMVAEVCPDIPIDEWDAGLRADPQEPLEPADEHCPGALGKIP